MSDQDFPKTLDYASPPPSNRSWLPLILIAVAVAVGGSLLFLIFMPGLVSVRASSGKAMCESNMHQIGLAILLYQNDHQQAYPNSLPELLEEQITPAVFVCPCSNDTPSTYATTQAIAADWAKPGHLSYIYLGKGLNDKNVTPDTVVLYEPLINHGGAGMNVLFGDGHTEWVNAIIGAKIITAVAAGHLPIVLNGNTCTVSASQPAP